MDNWHPELNVDKWHAEANMRNYPNEVNVDKGFNKVNVDKWLKEIEKNGEENVNKRSNEMDKNVMISMLGINKKV